MNNQELLKQAISFHLSGNNPEAEKLYKKILKSDPFNILSLNNLGSILNSQGDYEEAKILLRKAIKIKPDYIDALNNLGISYKQTNNYNQAIKIFKKIIELNANFLNAYINLGNCYQSLQEFEDAISIYSKVIKLQPRSITALYNQGICFYELNLHNEAINNYNKILKFDQNFIEAKWNLANIELLLGNYIDGWKNYEIRKKREKTKKFYQEFDEKKSWLGEKDLLNKKIYILTEQGLGDYIQFCRYLPLLKDMGANIILNTPKSLDPIIKSLNLNYTHINDLEKPEYDYNCYLMSLPLAFKTQLNNIPNKFPYLSVSKEKTNEWQKKLGPKSKKRIGLKWSGKIGNEYNLTREINLNNLSKILNLPYEFHSLHIEYDNADLKFFKKFKNFYNHDNEIFGFDNTAALVNEMDLIISIDTSVAHLSGALNKKTWLLLPFRPDHRWFLNRTDSPWYPSLKLYRQSIKNNWDTVINLIIKDLKNF